MDKVDHDHRMIALSLEALDQNLQLGLIAIHQRYPLLPSFRITLSRFAKRFLDHFFRCFLQTRPYPFTLRLRPVRFLLLVMGRHAARHILRGAFVGLHRIDTGNRRHPLLMGFLSLTPSALQFGSRFLRTFPGRFPQILPPHRDSLTVGCDHQDRSGLFRRPVFVPLLIKRIEVLCAPQHQLLSKTTLKIPARLKEMP